MNGSATGQHQSTSLLRTRTSVIASLVALLAGGGGTAALFAVVMDDPTTATAETIKSFLPQVDPRTLSGVTFAAAATGDCLSWELDPQDRVTSFDRVDCAQPHRFEVAGRVDLIGEPGFTADTAFPDAEVRERIGMQNCAPMVDAYAAGRPVDPAGRFAVTVVPPSERGWKSGDHSVLCGLSTTEVDGRPSFSTGRFAAADQHRRWVPGTCLGFTEVGRPGGPVDCDGPHSIEIVSELDVSDLFPDAAEVPDAQTQVELTGQACYRAGVDYLGGDPENLRRTTLISTQVGPISQLSWATGSRTVNCGVMKAGATGGFAVLSGPAASDLLVDGSPPVPPTTTALTPPPVAGPTDTDGGSGTVSGVAPESETISGVPATTPADPGR